MQSNIGEVCKEMNKFIESAIISNLKTQFPLAKVYTGKIVEGIESDNFVINTIEDAFEVTQSTYRVRHSFIAVTVVQPSEDITDELVSCLQSFVVDGETFYPDKLEVENEDDAIRVFIDLTHIEQ